MNVSLRLRLAVWYSVLTALAMIVFSVVVYVTTDRTLDRNFDAHLQARISHVQDVVVVKNGRPAMPRGEEQTDDPSAPAIIFDRTGKISTGELTAPVQHWLGARPLEKLKTTGRVRTHDLGFSTSPVQRHGQTIGYILIWQPLRGLEDARHSLLLALLVACPLLVILASGGSTLLGGRALRPVAHIAQVASSISVTDLHRRVPDGAARDELGALTTAFNAMIARLEAAVGRERRFTADASHELRSPLSVIRAEATLALDRPRSPERYRETLEVIDRQAVSMEGLIESMLILARVESLGRSDRTPVHLAEIVRGSTEQVEPDRDARQIHLNVDLDPALTVSGSEPLLTQAVRNLLHNAIKASPPGGTVEVAACREAANAVLTVSDRGTGIAPEHLRAVFEPFYQVDAVRTPGDSHGLGLAIVARIAEVHGGRVDVQSTPTDGTRFTLSLPAEIPDSIHS